MITVDIEKYLHLETDVVHRKSDIHVAQLTIVSAGLQGQNPLHSRRAQVEVIMPGSVQREEDQAGADRAEPGGCGHRARAQRHAPDLEERRRSA